MEMLIESFKTCQESFYDLPIIIIGDKPEIVGIWNIWEVLV